MILTEVQRQQLEEAAKPLMRWLNENCHPHCSVVVDQGSAELVEGVARITCLDYIDAPRASPGDVDGAIVHRCGDDDFRVDDGRDSDLGHA